MQEVLAGCCCLMHDWKTWLYVSQQLSLLDTAVHTPLLPKVTDRSRTSRYMQTQLLSVPLVPTGTAGCKVGSEDHCLLLKRIARHGIHLLNQCWYDVVEAFATQLIKSRECHAECRCGSIPCPGGERSSASGDIITTLHTAVSGNNCSQCMFSKLKWQQYLLKRWQTTQTLR